MTWRDPVLLWLILLAPLGAGLSLWTAAARRSTGRAFGNPETVARLIRDAGSRRAWKAAATLAGIACLAVALAGPRFGSRTELLRRRGLDLVVALDFSKSMLAEDVSPSRIERAKAEMRALLEQQAGDRIGLVAFAGETVEFPMTVDASAVDLFLRDLTPYDMPVGGTAIGRALVAAKRLLDRSSPASATGKAPDRDRVVLLITDGEDHEGDPRDAAAELAAAGIRVFAVGIGSRTGEPIPTHASDGTVTGYLRDEGGNVVQTALSADAEAALRDVAERSGGKFIRAKEGTVGVDEVRLALADLRRAELKERRVTLYEERYPWALLPAFLLLLLGWALPERSVRETARGRTGRGDATVAATLLGLALGFTPALAHAWEPFRTENRETRVGTEALRTKQWDAALAAFDAAAKRLPNAPGVHLGRGTALLEKGDFARARDALKLAASGDAPPEVRARAHHNLGLAAYREAEALAKEGKHGEASSLFRAAAESFKSAMRASPGQRDAAWNYELAKRRITEEEQAKENEPPSEEPPKPEDAPDGGPEQDGTPPDGGAGSDTGTPPKDDAEGDPSQNDGEGKESKGKEPGQGKEKEQKNEPQRGADGDGTEKDGSGAPKPASPEGTPPSTPRPQDPAGTEAPGKQEKASASPALPAHVERALDALRDGERSLGRLEAERRARLAPRRIRKDW